jgi:uncharacterized protein YutE (UPF0331/DUF86 family)
VSLRRMDGIRNVAVHSYQELNLEIVRAVLRTELDRILHFAHQVL